MRYIKYLLLCVFSLCLFDSYDACGFENSSVDNDIIVEPAFSNQFVVIQEAFVEPIIKVVEPKFDEYHVCAEQGVGSNLDIAEELYRTLPESTRNQIVSSGYQIIISNQFLDERFGYMTSLAGLTVYADSTIYLDDRKSAIYSSFYHEVGHFVDSYNNFPSTSQEFKDIMTAEKDSLYAVRTAVGYASSDVYEFFACVYHNIVETGDKYEHTAPLSYAFVKKYI